MATSDTPLYSGWHPNDSAVNWLGGVPGIDSKTVFDFMNGFASKAFSYLHSVNRLEITGRVSQSYFYIGVMEKGRINPGPIVVLRTNEFGWEVNAEDTAYLEIPLRSDETTKEWLDRVYEIFKELCRLIGIELPDSPWPGEFEKTSFCPPPYLTEFGQPGFSPSYQ